MHLIDGYGSTEAGVVFVDGKIQRPPVIDYKLVDVPELGYFGTDRPHPRGELLRQDRATCSPATTSGPRSPPTCSTRTATTAPATSSPRSAPDQLVYVDRRNNVLKLSQGEFVTVSKLEAAFGDSPLVRQIYVYGNSARPTCWPSSCRPKTHWPRHDVDALKPLISRVAAGRRARGRTCSPTRSRATSSSRQRLSRWRTVCSPASASWRGRKLKEHYGERLEQLYADLADGQADELRELRADGADRAGAARPSAGPPARCSARPPPTCSPTRSSPISVGTRCPR